MSWKTIFESARRMGAPVIVTDADGREPLVVLPLSAYEASGVGHRHVDTLAQRTVSRAEKPAADQVRIEAMADFAADVFQKDVDAILEELKTPEEEKMADISLEERFYLEPLDDSEEGK